MVHHPENDNKDSGDKSPSEETDFSPEGPAIFALLGLLLAGQEGVFFFDVSFAGSLGRGPFFGEERLLVFCHDGCQLSRCICSRIGGYYMARWSSEAVELSADETPSDDTVHKEGELYFSERTIWTGRRSR